MRQKDYLCLPHEAAKRLGITVDEVLDLMSTGELAAVTFMDDDRWFVELDSLDRMTRKARRRTDFLQLLRRSLDAIF